MARRYSSFLVHLGIAWAIAFFALVNPGYGADKPADPSSPQAFDSEIPPNTTVIDVDFTEDMLEAPPEWEKVSPQVLKEITPLVQGAHEHAANLRKDVGEEQFRQLVSKNNVVYEIEGVGRAKYNKVDNSYFIRAVHEKTKIVLLFLDKNEVTSNSKHLRQIVARQHLDAGEVDHRGARKGRDVVLVWTDENKIVSTDYHPRFVPGTGEWWADYWHASVKAPGRGDVALGCLCGALQAGAAFCVSGLKTAIDPSTPHDNIPMIMSGAFGFTIGVFGTTYRNISYRGSSLAKIGKLSAVSLLYAYSLKFMHADGTATLYRFGEMATWLIHQHIFTNTLLNNFGRSAWQRVPEIRNWMRKGNGTIDLTILGHRIAPGLSRATFEYQMLYLIPFTLKLVGLVGLGPGVEMPIFGKIDSGTIALFASIPLAQWVVLKVARYYKYPRVDEIQRQWDDMRTFRFLREIPMNAVDMYREVRDKVIPLVRQSTKTAGSSCSKNLSNITVSTEHPIAF